MYLQTVPEWDTAEMGSETSPTRVMRSQYNVRWIASFKDAYLLRNQVTSRPKTELRRRCRNDATVAADDCRFSHAFIPMLPSFQPEGRSPTAEILMDLLQEEALLPTIKYINMLAGITAMGRRDDLLQLLKRKVGCS